jgi:uncharacterized protein YcfL
MRVYLLPSLFLLLLTGCYVPNKSYRLNEQSLV